MDGLEDQAEAALEGLISLLYEQERVEIQHSSRTSVLHRIAEELRSAVSGNRTTTTRTPLVVKFLVFRSGASPAGLTLLHRALKEFGKDCPLEALEFVGLRSVQEVQSAIEICSAQPRIQHLGLISYRPSAREEGGELLQTIRAGLFGNDDPTFRTEYNGGEINNEAMDSKMVAITTLKSIEIEGYPIKSAGIQLLDQAIANNTTIRKLQLKDCDLRSDSTTSIARIIKVNRSLVELDLSYNRHYLGTAISREMTLKTLVQRGLRYNLTLLELKLEDHDPIRGPTHKQRSKLDRQLDISRFRRAFVKDHRDPFSVPSAMWVHVLARVSAKPPALFLFLQDSVVTLFR